MRKVQVTVNAMALGALALLFGAGFLFCDLNVQMKLTEMDRGGAINQEAFAKMYSGRYSSVRSREFAQYLAESWTAHHHLALIAAGAISALNLALALKKNPAPDLKSGIPENS
jgi:hypothetical protein